jgi:hypothetical protein
VSDLRRWLDEGGTPDEIALLKASQSERAPAASRLKTLRALGLTATAVTVSSTATAAIRIGIATASTGVSVLTKVVGTSILGAAILGGVAVYTIHRAPASSHHRVMSPVADVGPLSESPQMPPPEVPIPSPVETSAPEARTHRAPPVSSLNRPLQGDGLSQELTALQLAHEAVAAHEPEEALRLLETYRARFPHGALASEETVLRVRALLATGERIRAHALADAYAAAHPDSPYSRQLEKLVSAGQ